LVDSHRWFVVGNRYQVRRASTVRYINLSEGANSQEGRFAENAN